MALADQINEELKAAMKAKDQARLRGLRAIKSAILLANTEKGGGNLDAAAETQMLQKLLKQRQDSLDIYEKEGREDLAQQEREEMEVIQSFLPEMMSEADVKAVIAKIIAETGASSMKDMGKVMGAASKALAGKSDNKTISNIVKSLLGG